MTQEFVRFSPDVEHFDDNFAKNLESVIEDMKRHTERSVEVEGIQRAVRNAHAKGYGLARGEVEILAGLPKPYAQGIYGHPGRHEALVRFSQGTSHTGADRFLGAAVGIGLKIFGIDGETLLDDEPDSRTFDYAMINLPVFFVNDIEHYVFIAPLFESLGLVAPADESPEERQAKMYLFLHDWVTGKGTLPPERWAWKELATFLQFTKVKYVNLLLSTYWTMGAVRHGDHIAKVRVAPVQEFADRVMLRTLDPLAQEQVFRPALVAELRERPYEFDIQVQLCTDLDHMPVEDLTVPWSETLSPFVTVAKLRLPRQDIGGDDNLDRMDATSMTPWRVTQEHRPLGNIMRARKEVYRQSSILRHQLNHQVRKEPGSLAEVFEGDGGHGTA
ncbi:catalase family protein [Streptomyces kanamyceticus]|uniref:Catalase n=1 Tax=Streptomyces kanamyceticus TaxID=1967 RepID=A0A5J6G4G3_STRKN|nr:catalase family protein [Streptomyces kanamyceticus]QEU89823.1 catalase [Streptomyces kanamyceticus]